jgi:hypothetical protein
MWRNTNFSTCCHKDPPCFPFLSQINPIHAVPTHILKTHVNIIGPYTPRVSNKPLSLSFPSKIPSHVPHALPISWFDQSVKLTIIMKSWSGAQYHSHELSSSIVPDLAEDTVMGPAVFYIAMKFWGLSITGNILTTWKGTGTSRLAALHAVGLSIWALYRMTSAFCPRQRPLLHELNSK